MSLSVDMMNRVKLARERLLAVSDPRLEQCGVSEDAKDTVRPYIHSWILPLIEDVIRGSVDKQESFDAETVERDLAHNANGRVSDIRRANAWAHLANRTGSTMAKAPHKMETAEVVAAATALGWADKAES